MLRGRLSVLMLEAGESVMSMVELGFVCVCVFVKTVSIAIGVPVLSGKQ